MFIIENLYNIVGIPINFKMQKEKCKALATIFKNK